MRDTNGGFPLCDVFAALAARAEGVELEVVGLDVDLDAVVHFGDDENRSEGSVAARSLIEGRDAHEAMHAGFPGKQTVGVFTAELNGGVFDARFFARRFV